MLNSWAGLLSLSSHTICTGQICEHVVCNFDLKKIRNMRKREKSCAFFCALKSSLHRGGIVLSAGSYFEEYLYKIKWRNKHFHSSRLQTAKCV